MTQNGDLLRRWYSEVWENGRLDQIDHLMSPGDCADGAMPGMTIGPEEFKLLVTTLGELIHPPKVDIKHLMEQDDWVSAFVVMTAEPRDGAPAFSCSAMTFVRFDGGRIVEAYNTFDFLTFFERLGYLPESAVALLLSGQPLN